MAEKLRRRLKIQQLIPCDLIAKSIVPVLFKSPKYNVDQGGNVKTAAADSVWLNFIVPPAWQASQQSSGEE